MQRIYLKWIRNKNIYVDYLFIIIVVIVISLGKVCPLY